MILFLLDVSGVPFSLPIPRASFSSDGRWAFGGNDEVLTVEGYGSVLRYRSPRTWGETFCWKNSRNSSCSSGDRGAVSLAAQFSMI